MSTQGIVRASDEQIALLRELLALDEQARRLYSHEEVALVTVLDDHKRMSDELAACVARLTKQLADANAQRDTAYKETKRFDEESSRLAAEITRLKGEVVELRKSRDAQAGELGTFVAQLAMLPSRLNDDADVHDANGNNSTAEDRRARAYEVEQMLWAIASARERAKS